MHYGSYDFAINSALPTITAIDGSRTKGNIFTKVHFLYTFIKINKLIKT